VLTLTRPFGGDVAEAEPLPYRKPPAHELKGGRAVRVLAFGRAPNGREVVVGAAA
jgi:hypothetical protein